VDLDAFVTVHRAEWDRLDALSGRRRRLTGAEIDELVTLYQRVATQLSALRSAAPDPELAGRLSSTVARARAAVTGAHEPPLRELARFLTVSFPAAVWRSRWWSLAGAGFTVVISLGFGVWVAHDRSAQAAVATDAQIRRLVEVDFERYYSEFAASSFAANVWTNNALLAAVALVLGVTGVGALWVLFTNAQNVGVIGGLMAANGRLDLFFGLITPHGLLELTAIFVAAGAGLQLFWAWLAPGARPRGQAMAVEGRSMVTVAIGLVGVLLVSGVVEAFVTPSGLPTAARIGIGVLVWAAFLAYVGWYGRAAAQAGETGDLRAGLVEDTRPIAG
jgi:uncharacterized membrane protein SpoIIM required for sporulation